MKKKINNIEVLHSSGVTPEVLLQLIADDVEDIQEMFVVGIMKDDAGTPVVWASGKLKDLAFAALVLQDMAIKTLNGDE